MTFTEFKNIVENFQQYLNKCSELYQEGINIYNSDLYKPIVSAFYDLFESKFDEDRRNTLHWYINDANPEDCNIRELYALAVSWSINIACSNPALLLNIISHFAGELMQKLSNTSK